MYCCYQDCTNVRESNSAITFFQIPESDDPRRQIWINNSGNPYLRTITKTVILFFCENHFEPNMIRRQYGKPSLENFAIPKKYGGTSNGQLEPYIIKIERDLTSGSTINKNFIFFKKSKNILSHEANCDDQIINVYLNYNKQTIKNKALNIIPSKQRKRKFNYCSGNEANKVRLLNEIRNIKSVEKKISANYQIINNFNSDDDSLSSALLENHEYDIVETNYNKITVSSIVPDEKKICLCNENEMESDKHFLLSLLDNFQKLAYSKKTIAKIKVLQYLNNLENNIETDI